MGSWYNLQIDRFSIWGGKSRVEDEILALFEERDRRVKPDPSRAGDEGDTNSYHYAVPTQWMRERLDVLGFNSERTRADYERGRLEELEAYEGSVSKLWPPESVVEKTKAKTYGR